MLRSAQFSLALLVAVAAARAPAADPKESDLRVGGMYPAGLRGSVTESWGVLRFELYNPEPNPRLARVVAYYYPFDRSVQYARDVMVPGNARFASWLPMGPATLQKSVDNQELEFQLLEIIEGKEIVVWPGDEEKVRSRGVIFRTRSETSCVIVDKMRDDGTFTPAAERALMAAYVFRANRSLSPSVNAISQTLLPPVEEAYDGVDQVILAGNQLLDDPAGRSALRQWVARGGNLWVMLDVVDPLLVGELLGDAADIQVVDRVGLTSVQILRERDGAESSPKRDFDRPVDFVRVELADRERVIHAVNGWPASFLRPFGRGRILFTTLGAEAWHRPRQPRDGPSPFAAQPALPAGLAAFDEIAFELKRPPVTARFTPDDLRPMLTEEIGYEIAGRGTAALFLGAFLVALVLLTVGLRRSRVRDSLGLAAPAAAVLGAGVFVVIGERGRRAVPPTEATVEIVDAVSGTGEVTAEGLYALFTPESGPVPVRSTGGGIFNLDTTGLDGQARRRVQTDIDAWNWDQLSFPAGVRTATYRRTALTGDLAARAQFGPDGLRGRVTAAGFRGLSDGMIAIPGRDAIAVQIESDGTFRAGREQVLAEHEYIAGAVLSNAQQRRQEVYRRLLTPPVPRNLEGRPAFFVWGEPETFPFTALPNARTVRSSLLTVPLDFERPAPGTVVYVPPSLVVHHRYLLGKPVTPTRESNSAIEMRLRFQVPASVVPLTVTRATFTARMRAPGWVVSVEGIADGKQVPLFTQASPVEPVRVKIEDPALLKTDDRGGVFVHLGIALAPDNSQSDAKWLIESLSMEVEGRTADR